MFFSESEVTNSNLCTASWRWSYR